MSDYKIVNGKKVRVCKYNCNTELVWSDEISGFIETKGGLAHTQERCKQVKSKQTKLEPSTQSSEARIAAIIKAIQKVILDLEALKQ